VPFSGATIPIMSESLPPLALLLLLLTALGVLGIILRIRAARRPRPTAPTRRHRPGRPARRGRPIIVDGSNVLYWKDNTPSIDTLRDVITTLRAKGFDPGVVFDANAGYLLTGRYLHHDAIGRLFALSEENVMVVPKGTPADPTILAAARDLGAPILTNDRYRDWADKHPEIRTPGHLIRGGYRDGHLRIDLPGPR
jgi:hypothetical protein